MWHANCFVILLIVKPGADRLGFSQDRVGFAVGVDLTCWIGLKDLPTGSWLTKPESWDCAFLVNQGKNRSDWVESPLSMPGISYDFGTFVNMKRDQACLTVDCICHDSVCRLSWYNCWMFFIFLPVIPSWTILTQRTIVNLNILNILAKS